MAGSNPRVRRLDGWAIGLTAVAALLALSFFAAPPEAWRETWDVTETPVAAGWLALLWANGVSRRLRAAVAAGAMTPSTASAKSLPFLFILPAVVGAASGVALALSDASGLRLSHMSFLLPYATAFWGLIVAGAACFAHAVMVGYTRGAT